MAKEGKAKYFCENCGEEVAANARFCPHCGRFFSAVRCPKCGYMGGVTVFKNGCPRCHYAMTPQDIYGTNDVPGIKNEDKKKNRVQKEKKTRQAKKRNSNDDGPLWLSVVSIIALITIVTMLVFRCKQG